MFTLKRHRLGYKGPPPHTKSSTTCMTEAEHTRLDEIQKEYESMGVTPQWVDEYARMSVSYPNAAMETPSHNGRHFMLPEGTMPHEQFMNRLEYLVESIEKAEMPVQKDKNSKKQSSLIDPKLMQQELRAHLKKFKPINAKAFHDKMDKLIKEENRILTNIRINEASMAAYVSPVQPI